LEIGALVKNLNGAFFPLSAQIKLANKRKPNNKKHGEKPTMNKR